MRFSLALLGTKAYEIFCFGYFTKGRIIRIYFTFVSKTKVPACYGRVWPFPSISHLYVVISSKAIGPRGPNFWVLMPISAPIPNWPPSVKLVGALT